MMERKFIEENIKNNKIEKYLENELKKADYSHTEIKRTPITTRIIVHVGKPGIAIGRAGATIKNLTDVLKNKFNIENPQLDIKTIEKPELDPQVVAKQITSAIERGINSRKIVNIYLRRIMDAGAVGTEITISGKISGERSRSEKFLEGYIKKCGDTSDKFVKKGYATAMLKQGTVGIKVQIMEVLPDLVSLEKKGILEKEEEPLEEEKEVVEEKTLKRKVKKKKVKKKKVKKKIKEKKKVVKKTKKGKKKK